MANTDVYSIVLPSGFRSNCGIDAEWFDTDRDKGYSNFAFVDNNFNSEHTIRRVFSLARKLGFRSFLVETVAGHASLLVEEDEQLHRRNCGFSSSRTSRISFFLSENGTVPSQSDFLGYAVIRWECYTEGCRVYVYESVLQPYRREAQNNFLHCKRTYQVSYPFGTYEVTGALYAQQNGRTFVCAHVALRSALSLLLPEGDISYAEINRLAEIDVAQYPLGNGKGMKPDQMEKVFDAKKISFRKLCYEPEQSDPALQERSESFPHLLYGYIESSCPSLLAFTTKSARHVVPVLGHTFNEDTWVADARYDYFGSERLYSSEGWLSTYLIHDDNFGPYQCIPRNYLTSDNFRLLYGLHYNRESLCFDKTETVAIDRLKTFANTIPQLHSNSWYNRFAAFSRKEMLVLRSVFTTRKQYLTQLGEYRIEETNIEQLKNILPDNVWLVEISCPELFSATRAKFGEVLLTCQNINSDFDGYAQPLALRLPGVVYIEGMQQPISTHIRNYTALFSG